MILLPPAPIFVQLQAWLVGTRALLSSQAVVPAKLSAPSEKPAPLMTENWPDLISQTKASSVLPRLE